MIPLHVAKYVSKELMKSKLKKAKIVIGYFETCKIFHKHLKKKYM